MPYHDHDHERRPPERREARSVQERACRAGARDGPDRVAGFTLIELLVVIGIIGILAAIAVQQYGQYRRQAFDARARSDLRNAATAEEAYFATGGVYLTCADAVCTTQLPNFRLSPTVSIELNANNTGSPTFDGTAKSAQGSKTFSYDSDLGGFLN